MWHRRETRRQTEKTNLNLWYLEKPVYSTQLSIQCTALDGREFNISASCLNPGNTEVERRTDGQPQTGRDQGIEPVILADEIAGTALLMATLSPESPDANMLEAVVLPIKQKYLGRG
ncbi:MAG: hypothetical protein OEW45_10565 [Deltaproteobacteria bacterium]|nr:hypothetical protein [Deltaproteobacteria bacterium]